MTKTLNTYESLAEFAPDWLTAPGETIAELLEERGWSQATFATRTGFTPKHINQLLKGEASITQQTALILETVLGSTARYWLSLEAQYQEQLARRAAERAFAGDAAWLKELPLADMVKFGWVKKYSDKAQQVMACLRYWGVASVDAWRAQYEQPVAAYRAAPKLVRVPAAVSAWLRRGEQAAEAMACGDYSREGFEAVLQQVRTLTSEPNPTVFIPKLKALCASVGVAVVVEPAPKGCPVSGAAKWLGHNSSRALIMLSLRGKSDDKLWFSFFHEAAHLILHAKRLTFLDILGEDGLDNKEEAQADAFARDFLIPPAAYRSFLNEFEYGEARILAFARAQGTAPGIVLGRLQFDGRVPWTHFNHLKVRYIWKHED